MTYTFGPAAGAENPALSFVVPVKDEQATLVSLFEGITAQAAKITDRWEVVFVDDGSVDSSWVVMEELAAEHGERVKAIRFRHNAAKAAALAAGWKASIGESRVNKVELHDHNCGFKCYRREVIQSIPMYGEMHRMVPSLAQMQGFRISEIPVKHHPRQYGQSKYGLKRFLRGYLDMWTVFFLQNFRQRPMHMMGAVSLLMIGFCPFLALFLSRVPIPFSIFLLLSSALPALFIGAILIIMIGFLAEWNVHHSSAHSCEYPVTQTIGVSLPSSEASEPFKPRAATASPDAPAPQGATALLLDDKLAAREINAKYLKNAGWRVLTAGSFEEARTKLNGRRVDVILFDLFVGDEPNLTMADFVRSVREHSPASELIFLPMSKTSGSSAGQLMHTGPSGHYAEATSPELPNITLRALVGRYASKAS